MRLPDSAQTLSPSEIAVVTREYDGGRWSAAGGGSGSEYADVEFTLGRRPDG